MYKVISFLDRIMHFRTAYAHCDVPCGIYDPITAQIAAHTVLRMDMLIKDLGQAPPTDAATRNKMVRYVMTKEQHAEICKHEVTVLWGDYFKPEHAKANPELHGLVFDTLKLASKAKQGSDVAEAEALLENVEKIAEMFWKTKNIQSERVKSPYPTEHTIVVPKL